MTDIDEIAGRLKRATPGPWDKDKPSSGRPFEKIVVRNLGGGTQRSYVAQVGSPEDWELIAAAPTDIAYLLEVVVGLEQQKAAVLAIHRNENGNCSSCLRYTSPLPERRPWPCATVRALGVEA